MFDLMSSVVDAPSDEWLPCKDSKQMTILKNKEGGVKKFMVINKPAYGQGIAPKYPLRNFKDHEFMKEITDQLQADAVRLFVEPFDQLLAAIETQREAVPKRA